jgi:MTH538 TIR-like domain (DUF1863)
MARYAAFISYSHADERWARWLQRSLERYRIPRRLQREVAVDRSLPTRLYPVFRDRDELASATDLDAAIQAALDDSDALIVVCSPAAAASQWVPTARGRRSEQRMVAAGSRAGRTVARLVAAGSRPDRGGTGHGSTRP